jgi:UDP-N-acetyl-D-glucosamine dehydrogenase
VRVAIIGQGYVGSALGHAARRAGHEVIGVEIDGMRRSQLITSVDYFITGDYAQVNGSDIVVIAVPTPLNHLDQPDLTYLRSACKDLVGALETSTLIVNESTSFPGTLRNLIAPILGKSHYYATAPERIDPANKEWGLENTPRLVSGLDSEASIMAENFYRSICKEVFVVSSPEVAEAAKLFENTFRQVNIALVNEFAQIAHMLGISAHETIGAAATKPYGFMSFLPSVGVGGHCIPVDPSYLSYAAENVGVNASFINLANKVNSSMPKYLVGRIYELFGGLISGKTIQIAGISYKANVSDIRESPALKLINLLRVAGAKVSWHDHVVKDWNGESSTPLSIVDLGIIVTAHEGVDYSAWKNSNTKVIDLSTSPNTGWPKYL